MRIRNNNVSAGKIVLLVALLLVGLTVLGCIGIKTSPEGGSGGTVANGTLFLSPSVRQPGGLGCTPPAVDSKLVALSAADGTRFWEVPLEGSRSGGGFGCQSSAAPAAIFGSPAVAGELVYVGGYNGKIYAINISSGALRWVYPREGALGPIIGGVIVALDRVYFGDADGKVHALDADTGDIQPGFPVTIGDKIWATPAVSGETLYIGCFDKKVYALSAIDGSQQWEFLTEGAIASTPLVYNDTVYIGSFDRYFYALDAASGSLEWKFLADRWFWTKALVYNYTIYAGCFDGKIYALGAENGQELAALDLGSAVYSWPVLIDDRVIVVNGEGGMYAIDMASNQETLLADIEEMIYAPLSAEGGVIYVYSQEQNLHALNADSGARLWNLTIK